MVSATGQRCSAITWPDDRLAIASWGSLEVTPGCQAMVGLLSDLFGDDIGDALRSPYNLGNPDELADLISTAPAPALIATNDPTN